MLNIDKLLETVTKEELAEMLEGNCINKDTFREDLDARCETCPFLNRDGKKSCSKQQTEWLLQEYQEPIDWSHCGAIIIVHKQNSIMNGDIYMVNGSFKGKLYLIDSLSDYKKTDIDLRSNQVVPKSVLKIDDKEGETYKYYEYGKKV